MYKRLLKFLASFCLLLCVTGCIYLPILPRGDLPVDQEKVQFLTLGVSTREDVRNELGIPNILDGQNHSVYEWRSRPGYGLLAIFLYGEVVRNSGNQFRLYLEFDDNSKLQHYTLAELDKSRVFSDSPMSYISDGRSLAFDLTDEKLIQKNQSFECSSYCHAPTISTTGRYVAASRGGGEIFVWNLENGKSLHFNAGIKAGLFLPYLLARTIAVSSDGRLVAAAPIDDAAIVWDMQTGKRLQLFRGHGKSTLSTVAGPNKIKFAPSGQTLVTGGRDGVVKIWDVTSGEEISSYSADQTAIQSIEFNTEGDLLAVGTSRGAVFVIHPETGQQLRLIDGSDDLHDVDFYYANGDIPARCGRNVAFTPSGKLLAANNCIDVEFWPVSMIREHLKRHSYAANTILDSKSIEPESVYLLPYGQFTRCTDPKLKFSPNSQVMLATSGDMHTIWDLKQGQLISSWIPKQDHYQRSDISLGPGSALSVHILSDSVLVLDITSIFSEPLGVSTKP